MKKSIRLRRLEEKDIPGMLEWIHDPEINRWFRFDADAMTEERVKRFIDESFSEKSRHYAITNENDEYLGTISLDLYLIHHHFVMVYIIPYHLGYWPTVLLTLLFAIPLSWLLHYLIQRVMP